MERETLNTMFGNLLHIGNKTSFWSPKMKPYIYGSVNGIHVINLVKTEEKLEEVKKQLAELYTNGKKILFVGTKLQARDAVQKIAIDGGHYYVVEKWVPGLLTNWKTIKRRIATYIQLQKDADIGAFDILTKKEKAGKMLELEKLDKAYKGLKEMKRIPDVVFVVDGVYEEQAIREANSLKLTSFAILNTNGDDAVVNNCIPANTNSVKSINYIMEALKDSFSGKVVASVEQHQAKTEGNSKFKEMEKKNEIPNIKDKNLEKVKENKKEAFSDSEIIPISNTKITSLGGQIKQEVVKEKKSVEATEKKVVKKGKTTIKKAALKTTTKKSPAKKKTEAKK